MKQKTKDRTIKVGKVILVSIAVVGFVTLAAAVPNAVQALNLIPGFKNKKYSAKHYVESSIYRYEKQGYLRFVKRRGKTHLELTEKGKQKLLRHRLADLKIKKPKRWDKKWRVLVFDIKETRRAFRNHFREQLRRIGFVKLQQSVWVYPYDCGEIVSLLKTDAGLSRQVVYMVVDQIENDRWLRKKFSL